MAILTSSRVVVGLGCISGPDSKLCGCESISLHLNLLGLIAKTFNWLLSRTLGISRHATETSAGIDKVCAFLQDGKVNVIL